MTCNWRQSWSSGCQLHKCLCPYREIHSQFRVQRQAPCLFCIILYVCADGWNAASKGSLDLSDPLALNYTTGAVKVFSTQVLLSSKCLHPTVDLVKIMHIKILHHKTMQSLYDGLIFSLKAINVTSWWLYRWNVVNEMNSHGNTVKNKSIEKHDVVDFTLMLLHQTVPTWKYVTGFL